MNRCAAAGLFAAMALASCVIALTHVAGAATGLAFVAPALLLLCFLLIGCYPGAELIAAAARGRVAARRRPRNVSYRRNGRRVAARGGVLVALGLAGRAPPTFAS